MKPSTDLTMLQDNWKKDATLFNKFPKDKSKTTNVNYFNCIHEK